VAVDEATDTIYVVDASSAAVSVIDGATNTVTATIQLPYTTSADLEGGSPTAQGIAVDQATDTIFVSNWSLSGGRGSVSVIDGATNTVIANVPVGTTPDGIAVDQATGMAYVANFGSNTVSVIGGSGGLSGSTPGTIDVNSGTLSFVSAPGNLAFPAVTLDGVDQSVSASLGIDLGDNTGLGAGWQLDATGTELSDGSHSLPADAVTVDTAPNDACDTGADCTRATDAVSYPYVLPTGTSPPTATALYSAAVGTGMGDQTVTPVFSLEVPANAAAGAYSATWTFSLVSGP
jgi:YVTN family beta-propeller protein